MILFQGHFQVHSATYKLYQKPGTLSQRQFQGHEPARNSPQTQDSTGTFSGAAFQLEHISSTPLFYAPIAVDLSKGSPNSEKLREATVCGNHQERC